MKDPNATPLALDSIRQEILAIAKRNRLTRRVDGDPGSFEFTLGKHIYRMKVCNSRSGVYQYTTLRNYTTRQPIHILQAKVLRDELIKKYPTLVS